MKLQTRYNSIDVTKMLMAAFVVGIHVDAYNKQSFPTFLSFIFSLAVPFFFVTSGFLLENKVLKAREPESAVLKSNVKKNIRLYILWLLLYLPLDITFLAVNGKPWLHDLLWYIRDVIFIGQTVYALPLWYMLALIVAVLIIIILRKNKVPLIGVWLVGLGWMILGHMLKLCYNSEIPLLTIVSIMVEELTGLVSTNGIFNGLVIVSTGMLIRKYFEKIEYGWLLGILCIIVSYFLRDVPYSMIFSGSGSFLVAISFTLKDKDIYPALRVDSMLVFFLHMFVVYLIMILLANWIRYCSLYILWLVVFAITWIFAVAINQLRKNNTFKWIDYFVE